MKRLLLVAVACLALAGSCSPELGPSGPTANWPEWGGDKGGMHYSPLTHVNARNVGRLELAWEHHSGDFNPPSAEKMTTGLQVTPIVVNETLYYCTPYMRVFALDPETGQERWSFDPKLREAGVGGPYPLTCRGVAYWEAAEPVIGEACQKRILYGTKDSELWALDADTGRPCKGFGEAGKVRLREGIEKDIPPWEYYVTSPPLVMGDRVILGALVADQLRTDAPSGVVRAFDVRTGELDWAFDPVPPGWGAELPAGERFHRGTPNVWSILSGDEERGLVFVPTGGASPDSYGGERDGIDLYGSSTVALHAATGEVAWHFQTVHHDVWDYDVGTQPELFQIEGVGGGRPGVLQATKMGHVFLLDRETGVPLYPVEERPVPTDGVPGEKLSPTQPFPTHPPPLHPTELTPENVGYTFADRGSCVEALKKFRFDGIFTPPSIEGSIQYPHTAGGMNWGGVAIDPVNGMMFTNQTHLAMIVEMLPREAYEKVPPDAVAYPNELYPMTGTPYGVKRSGYFSSAGAPCNPTPWGSLQAVDLETGKVKWKVNLGTTKHQAPWPLYLIPGLGDVGAPNFGGGLVSAGGLFFIGATTDRAFRAFDVETGEILWEVELPFQANASPLSYRLGAGGRQFVVIAAGGNAISKQGDAIMAFALPETE
ncbi:MAG: pyrroloquinoline quinone-dependent dehydrogenase [Deltaproteobacteria bacterium]|nr:pyrroloquinoline quinone-dependent dehydrogenase [Deltaproteobacteria bacterium]MBW2393731.1 pyrroloquinoline quinone-dependent dehydrogenase [Deltaproteobacteria bacterium]